jgi:hypothetical protein
VSWGKGNEGGEEGRQLERGREGSERRRIEMWEGEVNGRKERWEEENTRDGMSRGEGMCVC